MMDAREREIIDTIAKESGLDRSDIQLDSDLYGLGINSLSALEILAALEDKYDVIIPDTELKNIHRVTDIARLVIDATRHKEPTR
jgi:acyl carrier protein